MPYDNQEPQFVKNLEKERQGGGRAEAGAAAETRPDEIGNQPEKTAEERVADFSKLKTVEEKEEFINEVLENSEDLVNAAQDIEIEAGGGQRKLSNQVGAFGNIKIKFAILFGDKGSVREAEYREVAKVAHKAVDKNLADIENTFGGQLIEKKENFNEFEKSSSSDFKNLESLGIHSPEALLGIKDKLAGEKAELAGAKDSADQELKSELAEYSETAFAKQKQAGECLGEYQFYYDHVTSAKVAAEKNIAKYEKGLVNLKLAGETAAGYREDIIKAIEEQKQNFITLEAREKILKQKLDAIEAVKKDIDVYVERIRNIGQTPEEIKQRQAKKKKEDKERKAAIKARASGQQPPKVEKPAEKAAEKPAENAAVVETVAAPGGAVEAGGGGNEAEPASTDVNTGAAPETTAVPGPAVPEAKTRTVKRVKSVDAVTPVSQPAAPEQAAVKIGGELKGDKQRADTWVELLPQLLNLNLNAEQTKKLENYFSNANGFYGPAISLSQDQAAANMSNFLKKEIYKNGEKTDEQIKQEIIDKIKSYRAVNL